MARAATKQAATAEQLVGYIAQFRTSTEMGESLDVEEAAGVLDELIATARQILEQSRKV